MDTAKLIELNKRYWQDMYAMREGTGVKPWECVKFKVTTLVNQQEIDAIRGFMVVGSGVEDITLGEAFISFSSDVLVFDTSPENGEWIFAAGIVEDKPAFPGDRLYHKGTRTAFTVGDRLVNPGDCSWKKPKKLKPLKIEKEQHTYMEGDKIHMSNVPGFSDGVYVAVKKRGDDIFEYETGGVLYHEQLVFCDGYANLILEFLAVNNRDELLSRIARGDKVIIKTVKRQW